MDLIGPYHELDVSACPSFFAEKDTRLSLAIPHPIASNDVHPRCARLLWTLKSGPYDADVKAAINAPLNEDGRSLLQAVAAKGGGPVTPRVQAMFKPMKVGCFDVSGVVFCGALKLIAEQTFKVD